MPCTEPEREMGLDMYLMAEQRYPDASEKALAVLSHLTEDALAHLADPDWGCSAYISGWSIGNMKPDPAYARLVELTGMAPTGQSPHFDVAAEDEEIAVRACCAYWRKANQVHNWFVEQVQGGADDQQLSDPIHPELLADLVDRCKQVLETPVLAAKLLPTQSGFFFGSTDYDEWYVQDLKDTVDQLNHVFETYPKPLVLRYRASW